MGLKFRRGTTAEKSGSLAFGEPYVNTTLGTLQIGGTTGDITLSTSGTGSQGSFAGISGSSLDITGNAKIDGNLTLGGAITIGDNTSDVVNVVASLSSSLIPSVTNAFDLGSASKIWRDLYISTGSIKIIDPGTGLVVGTITSNASGEVNTGTQNVSGSLKVSGSLVVSGSTSFDKKVRIGKNIGNSLNSQFDNGLEIGSNPDINAGGAIFLGNNIGTYTWAILSDTVNAFQIANNESFNTRAIKLYNTSSKIEFLYSGSLADEGAGFHNIRFDENGIIPYTSNRYDLGSETNIWRDLYISTGSIKMVNPANNQVVTTITAVAGGGIQIGNVQITTASISFVDNAGIVTQTVAQSSSVGSTSNFVTTSSFNSYTGSLFQQDIYVAASGSSPVRVGKGSGFKLGNTVLGLNVLNSNTTGDNNTMIGMTAGAFNQTADDNTFVGYRAGYANQTGAQNTAVGSGALSNNNYAGNTVLGAGGLKRLATGGFNTAIGYLAGEYAISGSSNNTFIGYQTGPTSSVVVNSELYIGAQGGEASLIRGNFANSALRVNGTMHVRDGLVVSGSITATGDVVAYSTSDKRHKNNIVNISDALSKVTKLNGVTWEWNDDVNEVTKSTPNTGLIAQEVQEVLPEVVKEREDGFLALDYSKMMGLMIEAIKEQQKQIDSLLIKINQLENK
jgi:hypothetical protein